MPRTRPSYILATSVEYGNLHEELLAIHAKCDGFSVDGIPESILALKEDIDKLALSTSQKDTEIMDEINLAKGPYGSIDERFKSLSHYDIIKELEKISTTRDYTYDAFGNIRFEHIRGDLNYDISYIYNDNDEVIKEIKTDLDGVVIGTRDYIYDENGNIISSKSSNAEDVMTVTSSLVTDELSKRLDKIESIDFVELSKVLEGNDIVGVALAVKDLLTRVQHLELNLPENIGYLINTSEIYKKLQELEQTINATHIEFSFDVVAGTNIYDIPSTIAQKQAAIYMEGLLLEKGTDYSFVGDTIVFHIDLIDGFTITCRN